MTNQEQLLQWFYKNQRKLPFRENKDPYKIWISEVMLQQTRVSAMLPSYEKFISRFPDILSLAESKEEEVIQYWKGLGYYSRAINLRKGAVYLKGHFNGKFPAGLEEALSIPGVGPYTARAVLSIAYNKQVAVLDGNVKRVLARYFLFQDNISIPSSHKALQELADCFLNKENPGNHNQAMMELGAMICIQNPTCMICPIQTKCLAFESGMQNELPIIRKEKQKQQIKLKFYFLEYNKQILIVKYKTRRFFKTIFTLPYLIEGSKLNISYEDSSKFGIFLKEHSSSLDWERTGKHSITHHEIELYKTRIELNKRNLNELEKILSSKLPSGEIEWKWIELNDLKLEFPSSIAGKLYVRLPPINGFDRLTNRNEDTDET
jgi:A/G-specific adenine glycosylase